MKRREFITLLAGAVAWPLEEPPVMAQPSDRTRRIAMLSGFAASDPEAQARVAALQQGLGELGWSEGRKISTDFRSSTGQADEMRAFAKELIELRPDLVRPGTGCPRGWYCARQEGCRLA